jgi:short subunit fatty acids transporter
MSKIGFYRSITDPAGFLQILSTSVSHMTMLRHQPVVESSEAIALSTQAIESVNKRLSDPVFNISNGIIVAILTFCCHTVSGIHNESGTDTFSNDCKDHVQRCPRLKGAYERAGRSHSTKRRCMHFGSKSSDENGFILVCE